MNRERASEEQDDGELVAACQSGDVEAFGILVQRHQRVMLNLAGRMLGDYDEACDVVQEAFVSAHRALGGFRGDAKFSTWLTTITLNQARNRLAQLAARRKREAYSLDAPRGHGDDAKAVEPPSHAPSALDLMERRALRAQVEKCIDVIPPDFREVLVLRDLQDRSYEEIGQALRIREGTVKSRLFRAREQVKDCLKHALGVP